MSGSDPVPSPRAESARVPHGQESLVVDASVIVDLLAGTELAAPATARLRGIVMHAPAHCDAEVLSALGRLHRAGHLVEDEVESAVAAMTAMPLTRHPLPGLLAGAWARRKHLRLVDALYIELGHRLDVPVITTDQRLARGDDRAEAIASS